MKKTIESMKLIVTIVERKQGKHLAKLYSQNGVLWHYQCSGYGTASSDLLDVLGFGTSERDILLSLAYETEASRLMYNLNNDLRTSVQAKGIIFSLPLNGINNLVAAILADNRTDDIRKGEIPMTNRQTHTLILVAVNQGHTDEVMDTAKKAGARGGSIIRARWLGQEESERFYGITLQAEKEILALVVSSQTRNNIMESINAKHGLHSEAGAMICSVGIDHVVSLT